MPRISAATVAEHRRTQRRALLAAAEGIMLERGLAAVTPEAVGKGAGLARSSFYKYFSSRDDLLAAVAIQAFEDWNAEIAVILASTEPGLPRLHAYVAATMQMTADGKHGIASMLQRADISPSSFDDIMAMHDTLAAPLHQVLGELGVSDPVATGALVQGLVNAGFQLIERGVGADSVAASINRILDRGVLP